MDIPPPPVAAKDFALLKNTGGSYFTLDEYQKKVKATQTDKDRNVVFLYTTDKGKQDSFIQAAAKRSFDVLELEGPLDSHFVNVLEQKLEKISLKRVDAETIDKLIDSGETKESVLSEDESKKLEEIFKKAINNKSATVAVQSMAPDDMPVTITLPEFMRRMKDMAATGGGGMSMMGNLPDQLNVAINANHSLVTKIMKAKTDKTKANLAKQAYDLALLSQNMLSGAGLTDFIARSVKIVSK